MSTDGRNSKASSPNRGSGHGNAGSDVEEGEEEDSSSSSSLQDNLNGSLSSFRNKWKHELDTMSGIKPVDSGESSVQQKVKDKPKQQLSVETKAKILFHQGCEYERSGKYYDAIQCYKNAMTLVPDIELKIYMESKQPQSNTKSSENSFTEEAQNEEEESNYEEDDEFDGSEDLLHRCQRLLAKHSTFLIPARPPSSTHISLLPMEIIIHILRFVMSQHHDARSLDICSQVCRGFYICARDAGIWRSACVRTWGLDCASLTSSDYLTWRQMYLECPRLETTGCYISKTSYMRQGDNSFQDRTHRPWHVVTYFRYLRFFPGGLVLLLTTADPPNVVVSNLRSRASRDSSILTGHYKLRGDRVFVVAKQSGYSKARLKQTGRQRRTNDFEPRDQTYHLELRIETQRKRRNLVLHWLDYFIDITNYLGVTNTTHFDTRGSKFPPYWFSRVKSYTAESDGILELNY